MIPLVGAMDDAAGYFRGRFVPAETTWSYMDLIVIGNSNKMVIFIRK